jgi:WD40 repeat protein
MLTLTPAQPTGYVTSVAFSPDGSRIASAHSLNGTVNVWDISKSLPVRSGQSATAPKPAENPSRSTLIPNSSFEEGTGTRPEGWQTEVWRNSSATFEWDKISKTGKRCVAITSQRGADAGWRTSVSVRPNARYRLSGWIRAGNVRRKSGSGAVLRIHGENPSPNDTYTGSVVGTRDWTRLECEFVTGTSNRAYIYCLLGNGGWASGKAWFDDIKLELVESDVAVE